MAKREQTEMREKVVIERGRTSRVARLDSQRSDEQPHIHHVALIPSRVRQLVGSEPASIDEFGVDVVKGVCPNLADICMKESIN
jgi:hypothetical protein